MIKRSVNKERCNNLKDLIDEDNVCSTIKKVFSLESLKNTLAAWRAEAQGGFREGEDSDVGSCRGVCRIDTPGGVCRIDTPDRKLENGRHTGAQNRS